jgi:nitrite reductase/ring-hydroxylating ferredoxin subunit
MENKMTRRDFIKTSGKTVLTALALTACADLFKLGHAAETPLKEITVRDDNFIITADELKNAQAVNFIYKGKKSILLYNDGQIRAFENICTHKGGPTALKDNALVCEWHGAAFNPLTGEALKKPAPDGSTLPAVAIKELDGKIFVAEK